MAKPNKQNKQSVARSAMKSEIRNTPLPRSSSTPASTGSKQITHDMIALQAYFIHLSGAGGSEMDNWLRAERELRGK